MRHVPLNTESVHLVLSEWPATSSTPGVFALLPEAEKDKLPVLQTACRDLGIALSGAIFPALLIDRTFRTDGVLLLPCTQRLPSFLLHLREGESTTDAERIASAALNMLAEQESATRRPTLFLIFDGMLPNIASLLEGIYSRLADRVHYAGVNAGSESFQPMPCLFNEAELSGHGLLALLLPGDSTSVLAHGFRQPERILSATATEGNRIAMIDWRPAFKVYQEIIKAEYGIELTTENFYQYGVHFPFGILRANSEVIVRIPVALAEDGSLFCVGEVPENSMLVLLKSPSPNEDGCIAHLAQTLASENGTLLGKKLLTFYCAGRRMHLGEQVTLELDCLAEACAVEQIAGALSLGEIGCTQRDGYPMFHNSTLVCTPWSIE